MVRELRGNTRTASRRLDLAKVEVKREYVEHIRFRFDHVEEPALRFALVFWRDFAGEQIVDRDGVVMQVRDEFRGWEIYKMGGPKSERPLLDLGLLLFGPPPWRRSCLECKYGVLGELEKHISSLAEPDAKFAFNFEVVAY